MFPFWSHAIAPLLEVVRPATVLEIGSQHGETTQQVLAALPTAELHVIDPAPGFDVEAWQTRHGERFVFHRALSLDVLPSLPPVDLALVDGDHNWFTVSNELDVLRRTAASAGRPLPVLVLHDVCWPYGRRDGYYAPETVPAEHRQPFAYQGMVPGRSELVADGGTNGWIANAAHEGGPRNGVRTALEDFLADLPSEGPDVRCLVIEVLAGLAIVASDDQRTRRPDLDALLDRLADPRVRATIHDEGVAELRAIFGHPDDGTDGA
ncbi:MAG: class I SAM-dependent methyltransferase [Acidimicrobiales bacterium]|nr:class I SAM-dependent methyltransferase [Acidimicrobiales bacterium]